MKWENLAWHVQKFDREFTKAGRLPRDKDWRPVRFAVRDVIIGFAVSRLNMQTNTLQVDEFMSYDPDAIPSWSGTKYAVAYILSQAYKCGSSMGISFTTNGGSQKVPIPEAVIALAEDYDVFIDKGFRDSGTITPKKARMLFLALTEFSPEAEKRVMELSLANLVAPERICYMVHHLTHTKEEMESILLGAEYPEHILLGNVTPEEYILYQDVVLRTRDVVLGGALDRALRLREVVGEDGRVLDLEGADRRIKIGFDPRFFAKIYEIVEETPFPNWSHTQAPTLAAGETAVVVIRARDRADFLYYFDRDLETLKEMKRAYEGRRAHLFLLVPRNISELDNKTLGNIKSRLTKLGVTLLIYPDSVSLLDNSVMQRLKDSETMRYGIDVKNAVVNTGLAGRCFDHNATSLVLASLPRSFTDGRINMGTLLQQALYDEKELAQGVNKYVTRARYHLVCDRLQFLAHRAMAEGKHKDTLTLPPQMLNTCALLRRGVQEQVRKFRLLPSFWLPEHYPNYESSVSRIVGVDSCFEQVLSFLKKAHDLGYVVVVLQDKHATQDIDKTPSLHFDPVQKQRLAEEFARQSVPDYIPDQGDVGLLGATLRHIRSSAKSAARGEANGVNLSEVPNPIITQALRIAAYSTFQDGGGAQGVDVNIVYTDGSQARSLPMFCLKERPATQIDQLCQLRPIRVGMISTRHPELNELVDHYWFRNVDVSQSGLTGAEVDELSYQITLKKLQYLLGRGAPVLMDFYQTGFQTSLVGFWRAMIETLLESQSKEPMLAIRPMFHSLRRDGKGQASDYTSGKLWC